jgi:Cu(I)/Ag(I) efflux system membrane fusion protein
MSRSRFMVAAGAMALALAGCSGRGGVPANLPMQNVGAWRVSVRNVPDPPQIGNNTLTIVVRDASGKPLRGSVDVIVAMEAMGTMPRMESRGKVKPAGAGVFHASYGLAMGGEWDVTVQLRPDDGAGAEAQYRLSTSVKGLALVEGTPSAATLAAPQAAISDTGAVTIDAARRQSLGIRTEAVRVRDLAASLRAPGRVAYDESHQAEISLKFGGWIQSLAARVTGQTIRAGEVLFTAYSPELWSAQQEYLEALQAAHASQNNPSLASSSSSIAEAARERLMLWDISERDLAALERSGKPLRALPIRSSVSGVVTEKDVVQGSAFTAGQVLFRVAQLDPIWVIASVPQQDAALVRPGMSAMIRDPVGGSRQGRVSFVSPALDSMTRTAEVRVSIPNPGARLQVGTFVDVALVTPSVQRLAVPESAVLPTGERSLVFVDLGGGRLAPREVQLGTRADGYIEVRSGLQAGEIVVTSGNFLVAAESKLRSAAQKW